jgi:hypothetical protein
VILNLQSRRHQLNRQPRRKYRPKVQRKPRPSSYPQRRLHLTIPRFVHSVFPFTT